VVPFTVDLRGTKWRIERLGATMALAIMAISITLYMMIRTGCGLMFKRSG
jgi:hypothetical protein